MLSEFDTYTFDLSEHWAMMFEDDYNPQDNVMTFLEPAPEFDPEACSMSNDSYNGYCKNYSETHETNYTDFETRSTSEINLLVRQRSHSSVMSFESAAKDISEQQSTSAGLSFQKVEEPTSLASKYQNYLLKLVDEESLDFILKNRIPLTDSLKEFFACNIEVMTKSSLTAVPYETDEEWVSRANSTLTSCTKKRKDQMLRMIFNKIVKMLVKGCGRKETGRESKASKVECFLEKYAPKDKEIFHSFVNELKFPSKKKLKQIFNQYKEFRLDFNNILRNGVFANEYLSKRESKSSHLVSNFMDAQSKYGNNRQKIVARLKDCIKSFPWSVHDLTTSCQLLESTLGENASFGNL